MVPGAAIGGVVQWLIDGRVAVGAALGLLLGSLVAIGVNISRKRRG
jgi:hypothetical protein